MLVTQFFLTLSDLMDCSRLAPLSMDSPGKKTGVDCHFLLQGTFLTQGSNPGLPPCRQTLYCLSHIFKAKSYNCICSYSA